MYRLRGKKCVKVLLQRCGDNISQSTFYNLRQRYAELLPLRLPTSEAKLLEWWKAVNEAEAKAPVFAAHPVLAQGQFSRTVQPAPDPSKHATTA